jgi:hypothetical protein
MVFCLHGFLRADKVSLDKRRSKGLSTRHYSSFLLRVWQIEQVDPETESSAPTEADANVTLQVQNLQSGTTWRVHSLEELHALLSNHLAESPASLAPDNAVSLASINDND